LDRPSLLLFIFLFLIPMRNPNWYYVVWLKCSNLKVGVWILLRIVLRIRRATGKGISWYFVHRCKTKVEIYFQLLGSFEKGHENMGRDNAKS
jgi:hypothetical protein